MKKNRTKKTIISLFLILAILILSGVSIVFLLKKDDKDQNWNSKWSQSVTVKNGVADPGVITQNFTIKSEDTYSYSYDWLPTGNSKEDLENILPKDLGFVTAFVLFDESGKEIFATAATAVSADTTLELTPGMYYAEYHYLTDLSQYEDFAEKYLCGSYQVSSWAEDMKGTFASLQTNGGWTMEYSLIVQAAGEYSTAYATGAIWGILLSICLIALFIVLITKDHSLESPKYDERQELERGRGFRYAFFTMLCFFGMLLIFELSEIVRFANFEFLFAFGLFLGVLVHIVYCIWHEAYFALNQKTPTVMLSFLFIGVANLMIAILNFSKGEISLDGHLQPAILNLFCTLLFLAVFITMFLKKLVTDRKNAEIEEADEEAE